MDVVRGVLGDDQLTYLGASYGTKLGATYAELFPDKVGRLVLDGAVDVSLTSRESSLEQAAGFQTALTAYVDHCLADAPCFLGDDRQAALDRITAFLDQVDKEPLTVGSPGAVRGQRVLRHRGAALQQGLLGHLPDARRSRTRSRATAPRC